MPNREFCCIYSISNATMPAATGAADEVPSLSSVRDSLLEAVFETLSPDTATPKALNFSTPRRYEANFARFPFTSAATIQKEIIRLADNAIESFAQEFDANDKL